MSDYKLPVRLVSKGEISQPKFAKRTCSLQQFTNLPSTQYTDVAHDYLRSVLDKALTNSPASRVTYKGLSRLNLPRKLGSHNVVVGPDIASSIFGIKIHSPTPTGMELQGQILLDYLFPHNLVLVVDRLPEEEVKFLAYQNPEVQDSDVSFIYDAVNGCYGPSEVLGKTRVYKIVDGLPWRAQGV